jgi:predicted acetyltransferase
MAKTRVRDLVLADRDEVLDVRHRSFGALAEDSRSWWETRFEQSIAARRAIGVDDGSRLVATARIHDYRQFWGGRSLPMAGVAGVVVAPEWRGRGVATLLMTAVLHRAAELGDVLSVLFPAAVPPYRRLGWEMAGAMSRTTFAAEGLRRLGASKVRVRRATLEDTDEIVHCLRTSSQRSRACGPLDLTQADVREMLADDDNFCYLAEDGVLVYAWEGGDLRVERLAAESAQTTRALWSVVGSGSSVARRVHSYQPAHDPIHWVLGDKADLDVSEDRWLLRIVDPRAAVSGRGFPLGVTADVPLTLEDPWLDAGAGSFRLRVSDGTGELLPADDTATDPVRLGPNGFAALYAGTPVATLRTAALMTGGSAIHDGLLESAFASRCYLTDSF